MKKLTFCIFLLCALAISAFAQRVPHDPEFADWETTPYSHPVPPEYANLPAYYVLNSININYKYEGKGMSTYYSEHKIIKVLDERGIKNFNTISIPVYHSAKIQTIKARTILRNGKVHEIPKEMIKVTTNGSGTFQVVIALEGVEKNAEIEYLLKEIQQESFYGDETFQCEIPVQNTWFTMSYPKELHFEAKSFNGFPEAKDTLLKSNRRQMKIYIADIPALEIEPYSFYNLYLMRVEYRLSYFVDEGDEKIRLYTWDDYAKDIHDNTYKITDKEKAAANKFISTLGVTNHGTELENIKKIENGIKNNIVLYAYVDALHADNLDSIITNKAATPHGYMKLFAACFTLANVQHELGITTDKHEHRFDTKFENWGTIDHYVFYFPTLKQFLSPTNVYYRYPMVPDDIVNNKGVFCAIPPAGKLTGAICEIKTITPLPANESHYNITADITFSKEMEPQADITYSYSGYSAMDERTAMMILTGEKKIDAIKQLITIADKPEDIVKYSISNEAFDNYYSNKPLEISATVITPQLIDKADKRYLLKIGDMIGSKTQLYKKSERKLPVDIDYPFSQNYTITVNIPKGYKILNPETIRKQADYVDANGKPVIAFTANYKITKNKAGDKLTVTIYEFCSQLHFTTTEYEYFRHVINTAADFNNVTLVLAKK